MTYTSTMAFHVTCSVHGRPSFFKNIDRFKIRLSSSYKPLLKEWQKLPMQLDVSESIRNASVKLLDAFVDSLFQFSDQLVLPSQSNFSPVDELNEPLTITSIEGKVPHDFPEGVYIRNGPNPLFGGLKSTTSIFGKTGHIWVEGEGMLHALCFDKDSDGETWKVLYNNRHVETETYKLEKQRDKPSFLPAVEGNPPAILAAYLLNMLRFGKVNKDLSNTSVFEHSGKFYSIAEHHIPHEIDIFSLQTLGDWDINGTWHRSFGSHPKRAPGTGELVVFGVDGMKPFMEVGVVSADGKRLVHKVDLKFNRCTISHDMGVTERYNVIIDFPLTLDIQRLIKGGPLIKFDKEEYARIGIMPRYGTADSIRWFEVEPNCTFHLLNCFEEGDEVVVRGCRSLESIISESCDMDLDKSEWVSGRLRNKGPVQQDAKFSTKDELLFSRSYEWRLNMETGEVKERNLTGTPFAMEFPMINPNFNGVKNKFGYTQTVHDSASASSGMPKFGGLAKLYFEETDNKEWEESEGHIKVEHHEFEGNTFCTGAAFVPKEGGREEDDGWIITFVHDEDTNTSKVYIIDTKNFTSEPVAKITLPCRVPYGFHGAFMPTPLHN
ncbi:DIOXYGENASE putative-RELATED [Salix viminalis]|uniref:DIOXYGENASE putative-RELATED n=1 Tax=Salix viminalis TaxID=40686 RepID=A0A9Q0NQQ9_SALVM|nr:DIOXYGENASE putative-RELATED [Salix viminalis]